MTVATLPHKRFSWKSPRYAPEYARRAKLYERLQDKEAAATLVAAYKENVVAFVNDWGMTMDPRRKPHVRPFVLWKRQMEFLEWLDEHVRHAPRPGVVDKARDCGVTWLCVAYAVWGWNFHEMQVGFGSRKEQLVDRIGDIDSIFEKVRFFIQYVPSELLSADFDRDRDMNFMKVVDPQSGAAITGEGGDNIGRGGRKTVYFVDEAAFLERPQLAERSLSGTTDARIDVSTHNGVGTAFERKVKSYPKDDLFVFDWRDDPRKDDAWYKAFKDRNDETTVAQEIDRDPGASVEGIVIPAKWVQAARVLWGMLDRNEETGEHVAGLDVADEGGDVNALAVMHGPVLSKVLDWKEGNTAQTTRSALIHCMDNGVTALRYDNIGVGAGVKGEVSNQEPKGIRVVGVNTGKPPNPGWYIEPDPDLGDPGRKNEDMFLNFRAQAWWLLRRRFQRAWERVEGIREWDVEDCIAVGPAVPAAATDELSVFTYKTMTNGKIKIESKDDAKKRGIRSPNKGDAIVLATCPEPKDKKTRGVAGSWRR